MRTSAQQSLRVAQGIMVALAAATGAAALYAFVAVWGWGVGPFHKDQMPHWLRERWQGFDAGVHAHADLLPPFWGKGNQELSGFDGLGVMPHGWAELNDAGSAVTFWDPGLGARLMWGIGVAVPVAALCFTWVMLARIVSASRRGEAFTTRNAARLRVVAIVMGLAPYAGTLLEYIATRWALSDSTLAGKATVVAPWAEVPIWPVGVAASAFALATVWRVGVQMRDDVDGLV